MLQLSDAEALFALTDRNREHLGPWLGWVARTTVVEDCHSFIENTLRQLSNNTQRHWGIWYRGELAGVISTLPINWVCGKVEIICWLGKEFQGKGLVTSALNVVIRHLFEDLGLSRIELNIAATNKRSIKVAENLKFRHEGTSPLAELVNGVNVDLEHYALLKPDREACQPLTPTSRSSH